MNPDSEENNAKEAAYFVLSRAMICGQISLNKISCENMKQDVRCM